MNTELKIDSKKANKFSILAAMSKYSVPLLFAVVCIAGAVLSKLSLKYIISDVILRLNRNLFLVIALIIPVLAGMGLNFAIVVGAIAGQIGLIFIIIMNIGGVPGLLAAVAFATPFAVLFGYGVGKILNKTKGREMITGIIMGFFSNGLYQLVFLLFMGTIIPVKNPQIILPGGIGLKNALELDLIQNSLDNIINIPIMGVKIPVFTFILIALLCVFNQFILKTKLGQNFRALGQDIHIADVAGINVDKTRIVAMVMSTVLAAWGQIIFLQNIGTLQTYTAHEQVGRFAVAALVIGGATVTKATIGQAILGTILFHTLFSVSPAAGKNLFGDAQMGEYFRSFIAYGVIALSLVLHAWQKYMNARDKEKKL
ncbi:ABC transporter permease subunit [Lutispora saccharofermentans]|uniref:ABC transporter permease n=1 Tax=Lutispora saccharofermentans TaxID=3024236 RepID=A0ABT1NKC4_9FIRM|nr:ABC transporter permease [Lutispora saccharofermentans]MCQ1531034.1 ABC transporter permease [Lutispora saccharofermentans]